MPRVYSQSASTNKEEISTDLKEVQKFLKDFKSICSGSNASDCKKYFNFPVTFFHYATVKKIDSWEQFPENYRKRIINIGSNGIPDSWEIDKVIDKGSFSVVIKYDKYDKFY